MARRIRLPFRIPLLRIFYSTTYTSLFLLELVMLAVSPSVLIYGAILQEAFQYIIIIGGVYTLTALLVLFIYSSRLYTNRTVLAALGKSYIPIEEGEVSRSIRKLIKVQLQRSALIALESRPRDLHEAFPVEEVLEEKDGEQTEKLQVGRLVKIDPSLPPWGIVKHPGWSSPSPIETSVTPRLFFMQVINELPNLLEARAVSLGGQPRSNTLKNIRETEYPPSQDPPLFSVRDYLDELELEGHVKVPDCASDFVERFEYARFSGKPLLEDEFVALTTVFAELLSEMHEVSEPGPTREQTGQHDKISNDLQAVVVPDLSDETSFSSEDESGGRIANDVARERPRNASSLRVNSRARSSGIDRGHTVDRDSGNTRQPSVSSIDTTSSVVQKPAWRGK